MTSIEYLLSDEAISAEGTMADVNFTFDSPEGLMITPLLLAIQTACPLDPPTTVVKTLLKHYADVNYIEEFIGLTPAIVTA